MTHSDHRAVSRSYRTRWLGLKQALHRPHSTLTARERPLAGSPARAAGKALVVYVKGRDRIGFKEQQAPRSSAVLL